MNLKLNVTNNPNIDTCFIPEQYLTVMVHFIDKILFGILVI